MKVAVIGGTGRIGSKVVARLSAHSHNVVAASPGNRRQTLTREELDAVMENASGSSRFEDWLNQSTPRMSNTAPQLTSDGEGR